MLEKVLKFIALDSAAPVSYTLDVPPAEAKTLLEAAAEAHGNYLFSKRFPLRFSDDRQFKVYRVRNRNSWRREFHATLENESSGTKLTGRFEASKFVTIFTLTWLTMSFGATIMLLVTGWPENIGALFFPIFGITLPHIGRATTRSDERAVIELLDEAYLGHVRTKETPEK